MNKSANPLSVMALSLAVLSVSIIVSPSVSAAPSLYAPGSALTTGGISNKFQLSSVAYNPASAAIVLRDNEKFRFGYVSTFGTGTEFGDVANFENEIDYLADQLDRDNIPLDEAEDLVDRFNAVLPMIGQDGYLKINSGAALPFAPMVFRLNALPGNFFVDLTTELLIGASFIDSPVETQITGSTASILTQSSAYLKSGADIRLGLGYAQPVWSGGRGLSAGRLIVGARLDVHRLSLSKQVIQINDVDDLDDTIVDDYDNNENTSTDMALSIGALWQAERYHLGFTVNNINEPTFEYGEIGANCNDKAGASQTNCFQAQAFAAQGRIDSREQHTMYAYPTLDASFFITDRLGISLAHDFAEHEDFVGSDFQWSNISLHYQPNNWLIPGARVGYKMNQVGTELSSLTFGLTLFRNANIDLEYGLDSTTIDEESAPRNFAFNFGFEEHF